jgi:hypothetical protein
VSERAVLILVGTGRTDVEIFLGGADGIRVGEPQSELPVPLFMPEPNASAAAAAMLLTLAGLAACRRRRVRL